MMHWVISLHFALGCCMLRSCCVGSLRAAFVLHWIVGCCVGSLGVALGCFVVRGCFVALD